MVYLLFASTRSTSALTFSTFTILGRGEGEKEYYHESPKHKPLRAFHNLVKFLGLVLPKPIVVYFPEPKIPSQLELIIGWKIGGLTRCKNFFPRKLMLSFLGIFNPRTISTFAK